MLFQKNHFLSLLTKQTTKNQNQQLTDCTSAKMVSSKLACGDIRGAVRIISSNDKLLENIPKVLKKLKLKHSKINKSSNLHPPPSEEHIAESLQVSAEDVERGIKGIKNGSNGGPDGLLPQHLKELTAEPQGQSGVDLLEAIANFFNTTILRGDIPAEVQSSFYGALLLALSKPGNGVKPIAVENTLRRLVEKTIMQKLSNFSSALFKPHQLGVGTPSKAEVAAHSLRKYIFNKNQHGCNSENEIILKIDFKNAFNSIRRDVVHKEIQK